MSDDLSALLHAAAPRPRGVVDLERVRRRARRIVAGRYAAAVVAVLAVAAGVTVAAPWEDRVPERVVGDPRPEPAPHEFRVRGHERRIPPGRRHEVVSGVFGDDWGKRSGMRWRVLVWSQGRTSCWQLATETTKRNESIACSPNLDAKTVNDTVVGGRFSFLTGSRDSREYEFVAGIVGPRVDRLVVRGRPRLDVRIRLHEAPARTGIPYRYYATTLPAYDVAHLIALSEDGQTLQSYDLCGDECQEQRALFRDAEVARFEAAAVSVKASAGAFANAALAHAGLLDQLGVYWTYRGIEADGDDFVASFGVRRCFADPAAGYACTRRLKPASIRVAVSGDRFVVEDVDASVPDDQRRALQSYSEPVRDDVREWRLVAYRFDPGPGPEWDVAFVMLWTGNAGAPRDYGSLCRLTGYDSRARVAFRAGPLVFAVGDDEPDRVVASYAAVEARLTPERLVVTCDEPRADPSQDL